MTTAAALDPSTRRRGIVRRFVQLAVLFALQLAILLGAAGEVAWPWAWLYLAIYVVGMASGSVLLLRRSPDLLAERGRSEGWSGWDVVIGAGFGIAFFVLIPVIAGLDRRFGWSPDLWLGGRWLAVGAFVAAFGLVTWSMVENAYFSTAARLQPDRGQTVCTTGPYAVIRHPGYAGAIVHALTGPVVLGSVWALVPGLVASGFMVARTVLEDRMLHQGLPGYLAYAARVRWRLIPGLC